MVNRIRLYRNFIFQSESETLRLDGGCKYKEFVLENSYIAFCTDYFKNSTLGRKKKRSKWWCLGIGMDHNINVAFLPKSQNPAATEQFQPLPVEKPSSSYPMTTSSERRATDKPPRKHSKFRRRCKKKNSKSRRRCMERLRARRRKRNKAKKRPKYPSLFSLGPVRKTSKTIRKSNRRPPEDRDRRRDPSPD